MTLNAKYFKGLLICKSMDDIATIPANRSSVNILFLLFITELLATLSSIHSIPYHNTNTIIILTVYYNR